MDNIIIFLMVFLQIYITLGVTSVILLIFLGVLERRTINIKEFFFMLFCYPYYIYYGYKKLIEGFIKKENN